MITIRHKTGPLAGTVQEIKPTGDRVTFGRAPTSDVAYPVNETTVSRQHFALVRKPSGDWTYDLFGDPYVGAGGYPVDPGQGVRSGETVELGRPGGPSFEIVLSEEEGVSTIPRTEVQWKSPSARAAAEEAKRRARGGMRLGLIGSAVALVAAIGAFLVWQTAQSDSKRLASAVDTLNREQQRIAAESFSAELRQKLVQAAYFVVVQTDKGGYGFGSASPIAPDLLATNAHVAEMFHQKGEKGRMFVRSPGANGREYEVLEVMIHPGYAELQKFVSQDPFFVGDNLLTGANVGSYDVALLRVTPGSNLGPILEVATRDELEKIEPGYPVMRTGYPTENVVGAEVNALLAATPNLAQGMISGMTDMFRLPTDPKHRRLIHHSVPSAGGASGSPLVGPNGKIVALNNAGSYIFVSKEVVPAGRISSSAQVNYGQRADWVLELLDKSAGATLDEDRKYWERQTAQFKRGIEVIVPYLVAAQRPKPGLDPVERARTKGRLAKADAYEVAAAPGKPAGTKRQRVHPVKLTAGRSSTFLGYAENRTGIQIYLVIDGKIVKQDERQVFVPLVTLTPDKDVNADIYITGPNADVDYTFFHFDWDAPKS